MLMSGGYVFAKNPPKFKPYQYKGINIVRDTKNGFKVKAENNRFLHIMSLRKTVDYILSHYRHGDYPLIQKSNGEVLYPYNVIRPVIFVTVRRLTVIKFPLNIKILSVALGNSSDFMVDKVENSSRNYLLIKSITTRIKTTMFVLTNKNSYYFNIIADPERYIPIVSFYYPDSFVTNYKIKINKINSEVALPKTSFSLRSLNFAYTFKGNGYKAQRVFNNGKFTYIKLKKTQVQPAIFVRIRHKNYLVNSLYKNGYYILRGVPKEIVLISRTKNSKRVLYIFYGRTPHYTWW